MNCPNCGTELIERPNEKDWGRVYCPKCEGEMKIDEAEDIMCSYLDIKCQEKSPNRLAKKAA